LTKFLIRLKQLKQSRVIYFSKILKLEGKSKVTQEIEKEVDSFFDIFKENENFDGKEKSVDSSEGEFFKNDLIPFSVEYYLQLVDLTRFCCDKEDCESH
jgi:hypothetical protein